MGSITPQLTGPSNWRPPPQRRQEVKGAASQRLLISFVRILPTVSSAMPAHLPPVRLVDEVPVSTSATEPHGSPAPWCGDCSPVPESLSSFVFLFPEHKPCCCHLSSAESSSRRDCADGAGLPGETTRNQVWAVGVWDSLKRRQCERRGVQQEHMISPFWSCIVHSPAGLRISSEGLRAVRVA